MNVFLCGPGEAVAVVLCFDWCGIVFCRYVGGLSLRWDRDALLDALVDTLVDMRTVPGAAGGLMHVYPM